MISYQNGDLVPGFYEYFSRNAINESVWQKIVSYFNSANSCPDEEFESRISNLFNAISQFEDTNPVINSVMNLFKALLKLYSYNDADARLFIQRANPEMLNSAGLFFLGIYNFVLEILDSENIDFTPPVIRVVISRLFNQSNYGITGQSLADLSQMERYGGILEVINSQDNTIGEALDCDGIVFFVGHGKDEIGGGFRYCDDYNTKGFLITGNIIKQHRRSRHKILGLFSCGIKPYEDSLDIADYFILPTEDSKNRIHAETFIKGFALKWKELGDIQKCIKLGLIALIVRSMEKIQYSVYKNGVLVNY